MLLNFNSVSIKDIQLLYYSLCTIYYCKKCRVYITQFLYFFNLPNNPDFLRYFP